MIIKTCNFCGEQKPLESFGFHPAAKDRHQPYCLLCGRIKNKIYRSGKTKEEKRAYSSDYYRRNKAKRDQNHRAWVLQNRAWVREYNRRRVEQNRESCRKWKRANPELTKTIYATCRKRLKQATPRWAKSGACWQEMQRIYAGRPNGYHVDHIVPIAGETVSGLHVPWNLQYLPALENIRKGNKFASV